MALSQKKTLQHLNVTSKVMKSSAKQKHLRRSLLKSQKTEASSSKDSQGQEEASAPGASSSKNQASAGK